MNANEIRRRWTRVTDAIARLRARTMGRPINDELISEAISVVRAYVESRDARDPMAYSLGTTIRRAIAVRHRKPR